MNSLRSVLLGAAVVFAGFAAAQPETIPAQPETIQAQPQMIQAQPDPGIVALNESTTGSVRGVVRAVDPRTRTLSIRPEDSGGAARSDRDVEVIYNEATVVEYRGQSFDNPQDIEIGDRVEARFGDGAGRLVQKFVVLSSVSEGAPADRGPSAGQGGLYEGRIGSVDPASRTLQLIQKSREDYPVTFSYDDSTRVEYRGRSYRPENLERGDEVQISATGAGRSLAATRIVVSESGASPGSQANTGGAGPSTALRGVLRKVDARSRTLAIDSSVSASDAGRGTRTVQYDRSTVVEYQGKRYGIQNLEVGDEIEIEAVRSADDYLADRIVVVRPR